MTYNKEYTQWVSYHDDSLLDEYNLEDLTRDGHHVLFPTHETPDEGDNVNVLNPVWSEIVTMWYVWKNNLRSDYVGFEHYRRHLTVDNMPSRGQCQIYTIMKFCPDTIYQYYANCHYRCDIDLIIEILNEKFGADNEYSTYLYESCDMIANCTFFMAWEDFTNLCDFLFPLIAEFTRRSGINDNEPNKILDRWKAIANDRFNGDSYQTRVISFIAERLISAWIENNMIYYIR